LSPRPAVDVVVPFAGDATGLRSLLARLAPLITEERDSVRVVDNRGVGVDSPHLVVAPGERTSYFARNVGAAQGSADWILFLDADVDAPADLLDRLFDPLPGASTGVLAGGVRDEAPSEGAPAAVRYASLRSSMSQSVTLGHGRWAFAQTANCAVRRTAFEAVGGFREGVRSGGDADLCYRLAAAGWELERREGATVVHRSRPTVPRLLAQRFRHGSGAAWLDREHPGSFPRRGWPGLALWAARRALAGAAAAARGDRDAALLGLLDGPAVWAFELGRLMPNRPLRRKRGN